MNKKKIIAWSLLIGWLLIIFFFSNQDGSTSSNLSNGILSVIENITHLPFTNEVFSLILRKTAHFTEYLILGVLVLNVIKNYRNISKKEFGFTILFCLFYAGTDEFHQMFINGRSPQFLDVGIDTLGGIIGGLIYLKFFKKKKLAMMKST